MFGARDEVDPVHHLIGTAFGWGGLPETEAFYILDGEPRPAGDAIAPLGSHPLPGSGIERDVDPEHRQFGRAADQWKRPGATRLFPRTSPPQSPWPRRPATARCPRQAFLIDRDEAQTRHRHRIGVAEHVIPDRECVGRREVSVAVRFGPDQLTVSRCQARGVGRQVRLARPELEGAQRVGHVEPRVVVHVAVPVGAGRDREFAAARRHQGEPIQQILDEQIRRDAGHARATCHGEPQRYQYPARPRGNVRAAEPAATHPPGLVLRRFENPTGSQFPDSPIAGLGEGEHVRVEVQVEAEGREVAWVVGQREVEPEFVAVARRDRGRAQRWRHAVEQAVHGAGPGPEDQCRVGFGTAARIRDQADRPRGGPDGRCRRGRRGRRREARGRAWTFRGRRGWGQSQPSEEPIAVKDALH